MRVPLAFSRILRVDTFISFIHIFRASGCRLLCHQSRLCPSVELRSRYQMYGTCHIVHIPINLLDVDKKMLTHLPFVSYRRKVPLRSTFQRSRGIIYKGWHLFSWNAVSGSKSQTHLTSQAPRVEDDSLRHSLT
jgi:hypothetical protein